MVIRLGRCGKCGKRNCAWRTGEWAAIWMAHDPESYLDWSWYTGRKQNMKRDSMAINWKWPGWVWLENTGEDALKVFCYVLFGAMMAAQVHDLGGVNWWHALSQAGFASLAAIFGAAASLKVGAGRNNGTASFLPRVVAADKTKPKTCSPPSR